MANRQTEVKSEFFFLLNSCRKKKLWKPCTVTQIEDVLLYLTNTVNTLYLLSGLTDQLACNIKLTEIIIKVHETAFCFQHMEKHIVTADEKTLVSNFKQ